MSEYNAGIRLLSFSELYTRYRPTHLIYEHLAFVNCATHQRNTSTWSPNDIADIVVRTYNGYHLEYPYADPQIVPCPSNVHILFLV